MILSHKHRKDEGDIKIAYIIDPIESFNIQKDSTFMMLHAAKALGWSQYVLEMNDLWVEDGIAYGRAHHIALLSNTDKKWYRIIESETFDLSHFSAIFMRKDPPFDMEYVYATYILEMAERLGTLIVNKPSTLRDSNEKFSITRYPEFAPKTLITREFSQIIRFLDQHKDIIVKPLDGMGGESIFRIKEADPNRNVILETITSYQTQFVMAQVYQKEIVDGDKRILIVDGEPLEYLVARIPSPEDGRGNTARGAQTIVRKLKTYEYDIAATVGKDLKEAGVLFAGIDVIGSALTEINITSPTMIQQIYHQSGVNAAERLMEIVKDRIS